MNNMAMSIVYTLARLFSITLVYCAVVALLKHAFDVVIRLYTAKLQQASNPQPSKTTPKAPPGSSKAILDQVEPLLDFDYQREIPSQFRPFKLKGHVKMGMAAQF